MMADVQSYRMIRVLQITADLMLDQAFEIVKTYSTVDGWFDNDELVSPTATFADFLSSIQESESRLRPYIPAIIDAKRDDQPVWFGEWCKPTAFQVGLEFGMTVAAVIRWGVWIEGQDGPEYEFYKWWPTDGLTSEHRSVALRERWMSIRDSLAALELGPKKELQARLDIEVQRVRRDFLGENAPQGTITPKQKTAAKDPVPPVPSRPEVRHPDLFQAARNKMTPLNKELTTRIWQSHEPISFADFRKNWPTGKQPTLDSVVSALKKWKTAFEVIVPASVCDVEIRVGRDKQELAVIWHGENQQSITE